jgi:hypothetical protein
MRVVRILWAALFASTATFIVVLFLVPVADEPAPPILLPIFAALAISLAVISVLFPRYAHRLALLRGEFPVEEVDDPDAIGMFRASAPKKRIFAEPERTRERAFFCYQTPFILGMALSEAIAMFGFVLGFLGFPLPHVLPFWAVAWILFAWRFPTERKVFEPLETSYKAKLT